ncbi:uncharacterized protein LOC117168025 [Belonocnema kinseyi]|uniref:uncharacterized protein LOC117168025 n=1 Tax=Belonocnema kinseyi TaxID=2817044 RepID=UPI00143CE90B|nr:uncharacterized protein LOC117168025 [Belonocnema kinseyi]
MKIIISILLLVIVNLVNSEDETTAPPEISKGLSRESLNTYGVTYFKEKDGSYARLKDLHYIDVAQNKKFIIGIYDSKDNIHPIYDKDKTQILLSKPFYQHVPLTPLHHKVYDRYFVKIHSRSETPPPERYVSPISGPGLRRRYQIKNLELHHNNHAVSSF